MDVFPNPAAILFQRSCSSAPFKEGTGLMFRFAAYKDKHSLTDLEIRVNVGLQVLENDKPVYKYFPLILKEPV
jgi:inward rectifier potassium channel